MTSCRNRQAGPKTNMEMQKTKNSENKFGKEQNWTTHTSQIQNILFRTMVINTDIQIKDID